VRLLLSNPTCANQEVKLGDRGCTSISDWRELVTFALRDADDLYGPSVVASDSSRHGYSANPCSQSHDRGSCWSAGQGPLVPGQKVCHSHSIWLTHLGSCRAAFGRALGPALDVAAHTECTTDSEDRHVTNIARFPPIEILRQQSIAIQPVDLPGTGGTPMTSTVDHLASVPFCAMSLPSTDVDVTRREGGTLILRSRIKLEDVSGTICSFLPHWAQEAPDRMFLAQRAGDNVWQRISYGEFWPLVQSVGQALLNRGGVAGDTLAILSGNSIENAIIQFGAMSVGLRVSRSRRTTASCRVGSAALRRSARFLRQSMCSPRRLLPISRPAASPALRKPNG
jgi:hypothetical protein